MNFFGSLKVLFRSVNRRSVLTITSISERKAGGESDDKIKKMLLTLSSFIEPYHEIKTSSTMAAAGRFFMAAKSILAATLNLS